MRFVTTRLFPWSLDRPQPQLTTLHDFTITFSGSGISIPGPSCVSYASVSLPYLNGLLYDIAWAQIFIHPPYVQDTTITNIYYCSLTTSFSPPHNSPSPNNTIHLSILYGLISLSIQRTVELLAFFPTFIIFISPYILLSFNIVCCVCSAVKAFGQISGYHHDTFRFQTRWFTSYAINLLCNFPM